MRQSITVTAALTLLIAGLLRAEATSSPSYPDTVEGLRQFLTDLLAVAEAGDRQKVQEIAQSMILPDPQSWFTQVFGDEKGTKLAEAYPAEVKFFPKNLTARALALRGQKTSLSLLRVESADDPNARAYQRLALAAMKRPVALYWVKITIEGQEGGVTIWSIVHADGSFRMVSKMRALTDD